MNAVICKRLLVLCGLVAVIAIVPPKTHATVYEYELEGKIAAPIYHEYTRGGVKRKNLVSTFEVTINPGELRMIYDDKGTGSLLDDRVNISGKTSGCLATKWGCDKLPNPSLKVPIRPTDSGFYSGTLWDTFVGTAELTWDITLENPIVDPDKDFSTQGHDEFAFGMQNEVGSLTVAPIWGAPLRNPTADISTKNNKDGYAFRLYNENGLDDGEFRIASWILVSGGFVPGFFRLESLLGEPVFNSDIVARLVGTNGGPPPTEVPEPATLFLLGSAIIGCSGLRRKQL